MSRDDLAPLAPDVERLLDRGRHYLEGPAPDAAARLRARVLAPLPVGGGPTGAAGGAATAAASSGAAALLAKPLVLAVTTFVLGAGAGALLHARLGGAPPPLPAPAAPLAAAPAAPESQPVAAPVASPSCSSAASAPSPPCNCPAPRAAPPSTQTRDADLAAERALLETARTALDRRDLGQALAIVESHARTYPRGRLVEEREALAVQALLLDARYDQVRRRGAAFLKRYPRSLFGPAVEEALTRAADTESPGLPH
jgi:hypothetical protein